jgi:murein DD-endopeptidase MepM/ murein hydrolase activator NlpD
MRFILSCMILVCIGSCIAPRSIDQRLARNYQRHKIHEDTSYLYQLPFSPHTSHRMVQGYYSRFTHKYKAAVDFKMKPGTKILAARAGHVIRIKDDSDQGGWNKKYRPDANYIIIQHDDSTRSNYRHLQYKGILVKPGEWVSTGQVIGYSGNTGYTASPHLHFMVTRWEEGRWVTIPTRFISKRKEGYLRGLYRYTSVNYHSDTIPKSTESLTIDKE